MSAALLENFELLAASVGGVARLRELILSLAVRGKLVPQDPNDEPASELLKRIRTEKDRLIKEGKIKREKLVESIAENEAPYEIPQNWAWIRFGELGTIGSSSRVHQRDWTTSGIPFYRAREIVQLSKNDFVANELFITEELFTSLSHGGLVPERDDIMITGVGTIGVPYIVKAADKFYFKDASVLIFKNRFRLDPNYLSLFMQSPDWVTMIHAESMGTTVHTLTIGRATEAPVPLPPLAEQSRIVAKVEELMALCDRLEAEQGHAARVQGHWVEAALDRLAESADADEFRRHWQHLAAHFDTLFTTPESIDRLDATLLQLAVRGKLVPQDPNDEPASELLKQIRAEKDRLIKEGKIKRDKPLPPITDDEKRYELPEGWEWARLNDIYDVRDGTHDSPKFHDKGVPLVTSKNIYSGVLDLTNVKFISKEDHQQISIRSKVDRGDILFAMIGSIGNPVIVDVDADFSIKNMALFKRYKSELSNTNFLLLSLKVAAVNMRREAAGGVQSFISLGGLRKHSAPLPPLAEQARIVSQVEKLQSLTASLKARLTAAQTKQAHLAEALIAEVV